jgi:hypothetical protein
MECWDAKDGPDLGCLWISFVIPWLYLLYTYCAGMTVALVSLTTVNSDTVTVLAQNKTKGSWVGGGFC